MDVLAELFLILIIARAFGAVAERLGQPSSIGELIAGVFIAVLAVEFGQQAPILAQLPTSQTLEIVANFGIFMLVLVAGIELQPAEIIKHSGTSFAVAIGGMFVPLFAGIAVVWAFLPDTELKAVQALVVGAALSISAIPASVKVLVELDMLHSKIGRTIVAAAMFDDILGLFLLALLLAVVESGQLPDLAAMGLLVAKVMMFFAITIALGVHVYPHVRRGIKSLEVAAIDLSALAAVALAYGWLAEALSMHWIMGAFMAGLFFEKARVGGVAYNEMRLICGAMTNGVLGPLFFVYIGIHVDLFSVFAAPVFLCALLLVAILGKVVGAGLPGLWCGLSRQQALSVGVGLSARGAVELVFISIAFQAGLFTAPTGQNGVVDSLFSSLILVGVLTTLAVPILLPYVVPRD